MSYGVIVIIIIIIIHWYEVMCTAQSFLNRDLLWQAENYPSGQAEISCCSSATTNVHPSLLFDHLLLRSSVSRSSSAFPSCFFDLRHTAHCTTLLPIHLYYYSYTDLTLWNILTLVYISIDTARDIHHMSAISILLY